MICTCSVKHLKGKRLPRDASWKGTGGKAGEEEVRCQRWVLKMRRVRPDQAQAPLARPESSELRAKAAGVLTRCHGRLCWYFSELRMCDLV